MPKRYTSTELIKMVEKDGWRLVQTKGSHRQYKHPTKKGRVTIVHPKKDVEIRTVYGIFRQAGIQKGDKNDS